jgi:hypothetical protein
MRHRSDRSYNTWHDQIAESAEGFMRWIDSASAASTCQLARIPMGPSTPKECLDRECGYKSRRCTQSSQGVRDVDYKKLNAMKKEQKQ